MLSVCIFAHDLARALPECVAALDAAAAGRDWRAVILENGSTDATPTVAAALAKADARITVARLPVADKSNAWNDYVHRLAPTGATHVFLDGDCAPCPGAFAALAAALADNPQALAAAALPAAGRSMRAWIAKTYEDHGLSGNLYALSQDAIERLRARAICLPFGAVGEDGILAYLLRTDLEGGADDSRIDRIEICDDAWFTFDSLRPTLRDARLYFRRLRRYSRRHFQKQALYALLKSEGAGAMPRVVDEIYTPEAVARMTLRRDPVNFPFDAMTLAALRRRAAQSSAARSRYGAGSTRT